MSEISETEIKSMTKEQNYMRGYKDGKTDVLNQISEEVDALTYYSHPFSDMLYYNVQKIINKYKAESEEDDANSN